jgi:hypothetical protein
MFMSAWRCPRTRFHVGGRICRNAIAGFNLTHVTAALLLKVRREGHPVAIYRILDDMDFDEQSKKAMTTAYEVVLVELRLTDRTDPITITVANTIISICRMERCDADRLIELTLKELRQ